MGLFEIKFCKTCMIKGCFANDCHHIVEYLNAIQIYIVINNEYKKGTWFVLGSTD